MLHSQGKYATLHSVCVQGRWMLLSIMALWSMGHRCLKKNSNGMNYNGQTGQETDHFFHLCTPHSLY